VPLRGKYFTKIYFKILQNKEYQIAKPGIEILNHFENNFESFLPRRGIFPTFGVRSHRRKEKN